MSVTVRRVGEAVEALQGARSLPEGEEIVLFTASDLINLDRERREEVDLEMPSSLCGAEDEDAGELFHLSIPRTGAVSSR
jgi:hypothetical protein